MSNNKIKISAVRAAISQARLVTYEMAAGVNDDEDLAALELYAWNAAVSGAFLAPLHVCEVVLRNTVADALEAVYGPRWPWEPVFEHSLPNPSKFYSPRKYLVTARGGAQTTGELEQVRRLRNRIAHHEPIFARNLAGDYQNILALVAYRCTITAAWLDGNQQASSVLADKPCMTGLLGMGKEM